MDDKLKEKYDSLMDELAKVDLAEKPKFITFGAYNKNCKECKYLNIDLTPHIDLIIDKQMELGIKNENNGEIVYYGRKEYTLSLDWLGFTTYIIFTILTNKWEK